MENIERLAVSSPTNKEVIEKTGHLFGDLWHRYDEQLFEESVSLFAKRLEANDFDLAWFRDKTCLDAGCGGGRYSIAMSRLGAKQVVGADISGPGLNNARMRAQGLSNVRFDEASVLALPYADESFDFVCCSGVLHHTSDPNKGLSELTRVLKKQGKLYLLLYGAFGLKWSTVLALRPHMQQMGYAFVDKMMKDAELPSNKQRTFLDDLFVPVLKFYEWDELKTLLEKSGYTNIERWEKGKLDHEANPQAQRVDFNYLRKTFEMALKNNQMEYVSNRDRIEKSLQEVMHAIDAMNQAELKFNQGLLSEKQRDFEIQGWGHHRVLAIKKG